MKKLALALLCLVCIPIFAIPAHAWEFEMTGNMNWTYEVYNQRGNRGFFGPYNIDVDAPNNLANLNFWWNGARLSQNFVTGEDAAKSYLYVILDPTIKINPAIKLRSRIRLGQWNNPVASYYYTQDSPGTDNAMSEAQFTMFWATAQLPWGTLGVGKRPWKFGTGLQYDGSDGLSTESIVLNSGYGPFDIGFGFYAHRPINRAANLSPGLNNAATTNLDPYDLAIFGVAPYFNHADKSGAMITDVMGYTVYNNGPMQMGILGAVGNYHVGPEGALRPAFDFNENPFVSPLTRRALDSSYFHGTAFTKFNNGRFFFNAEAAWLYWTDRVIGSWVLPAIDPTGVGALPTPRYTEQWRFMVETGVMAGPSKLTFLAALSPGPDRRNGALHDKQSAAFVWHPTYDTFLGNYDVFRPYSWLFTYNYGSGFNAYNLSLDGYLRDALVLASRLDYAAAANLNVFGSFFYAERQGHGYGWGAIGPNGSNPVFSFPDGNLSFNLNGNVNAAPGSIIPNIPDTSLGWEATTGVDWQLLDGFTVGVLAAYWQPGKWFNFACIDRSVPGWRTAPSAANNWGTRPNKTIDPILGGQVTLNFAF